MSHLMSFLLWYVLGSMTAILNSIMVSLFIRHRIKLINANKEMSLPFAILVLLYRGLALLFYPILKIYEFCKNYLDNEKSL